MVAHVPQDEKKCRFNYAYMVFELTYLLLYMFIAVTPANLLSLEYGLPYSRACPVPPKGEARY